VAREHWGSRIGVILAVAGSAVGLGNFLRFPGTAAANGGGAFMIPYFCALIFLGIPICWAEWTMGRYGGQSGFNSCPAIFGVLGRRPVWRYLGVLGLLIPVMIYTYYVLIESWCLGYAYCYLTGQINLGTDANLFAERSSTFFDEFTGSLHDGLMLDGRIHISVVFWVIVFTINFILIYRGVAKGIELFCRYAIPVMALCAVAVLIRVLTLGTPNPDKPELSVLNGLGYMWNPHAGGPDGGPWYEALLNSQTWLAAAGQIFFSLSVGFGIIINFSSYLRRRDDVVLSGLTACSTNEFFEVCLGGLITIPAAYVFLGVAGASVSGTFDLGFKTLPVVFLYMPGGRIFGFLWFFMLFLAAITSSLSMLQPAIAFLEEGIGIRRRASVALLGLITALGSLFVIYFSKDRAAQNTLDEWIGTVAMVLLATIEVFLFAWVFGTERGYKAAMHGAEMRLPRAFKFVIKFVAPLYLLIVLVLWCWHDLPAKAKALKDQQVPMLTICLILVVMVFFLVMINIAGRRWKAEQMGRALLEEEIEAERVQVAGQEAR